MINDNLIKSGLALFLVSSWTSPAFAYLDGATGSMLLQALIGGTATAMVFGRTYIAKLKTLISGAGHKAKDTGKSE